MSYAIFARAAVTTPVVAAPLAPPLAIAAVGRTRGANTASSTGNASDTIRPWAPPGTGLPRTRRLADSRATFGIHPDRPPVAWRRGLACVLALVALTGASAHAATAEFRYDALGRLERVTNSDGTVVIYKLDAAGNRTQVISGTSSGVPPWISVPASSTTGAYTISWGAATGTVTAYQLYQATNSGFSGEQLVYSGAALDAALSGRPNGTYYYRVRACLDDFCSSPQAGSNGVTVTLPPQAPDWISVPASSSTGSYTISWGAASGTVTAYRLYEATNSSFSGEAQVYSGAALSTALSGRANGAYYYRVQACNGSGCSTYRAGSNGVSVSIVVPIEVLNPSLSIGPTTTSITALANLNGNPATIHSFTQSCAYATATIAGGAQSVSWTNSNYYYWQCESPEHAQCSASYVIRNSTTGQLHSGTAWVTILDQPQNLPPNVQCP